MKVRGQSGPHVGSAAVSTLHTYRSHLIDLGIHARPIRSGLSGVNQASVLHFIFERN